MVLSVPEYYNPRFITGRWGDPRPNGRIHEGIDYSHSTRPDTIDIPALLPGRVSSIWTPSNNHGYGYRVDTQTVAGLVSYAHLARPPAWRVGDQLAQGAVVGREGTTGWITGPCCHLEQAVNGRKRDPWPLVRDVLASTAGGGGTPFPIPPDDDEGEDMKTSGIAWTSSDGVPRYALTTPGSGYWSEWQEVDGAYNNAIAAAFDTGTFAAVTQGHRDNLYASALAVRMGAE